MKIGTKVRIKVNILSLGMMFDAVPSFKRAGYTIETFDLWNFNRELAEGRKVEVRKLFGTGYFVGKFKCGSKKCQRTHQGVFHISDIWEEKPIDYSGKGLIDWLTV